MAGVKVLSHFVIPHLKIRACDWSKSRHVAVNISREFPRETILPSLIMHVSFSVLIFLNNSWNHSTDTSRSQFFASYVYLLS